jgi:hypothetical protein
MLRIATMPKEMMVRLTRREREIVNALFALDNHASAEEIRSRLANPKRSALQQLVQTFWGGSLREMMTALVTESSWTNDDLDALRAEIERVRKERKLP